MLISQCLNLGLLLSETLIAEVPKRPHDWAVSTFDIIPRGRGFKSLDVDETLVVSERLHLEDFQYM